MSYKRILLKLSGEALQGNQTSGIDSNRLMEYVQQIKEIADEGIQVGIVIGGGNIFRGLSGVDKGFDRVKGDYMGMLATVINGLALQSALESIGAKTRLLTAVNMGPVGDRFSKHLLNDALAIGEIVVFGFGTGNPYFTTDTAASLRAVEMQADVLLKGTRVDGVYTSDPEKDPKAEKYNNISFSDVIKQDLKVMDQTAFTMCRENNLPIIVFDMNKKGNLKKLILGEKIGTLVKN
jgi:uridylate kinase